MKLKTKLVAILSVLFLVGCNDDDNGGPSTPQPTGTVSASIQSINLNNGEQEQDQDWSLPSVTAELGFSGLTITATNSGTGETLTIFLPSISEGFYNNDTENPDLGFATYVASSGADTLSSLNFNAGDTASAVFTVQITSYNDTTQILEGEILALGVYSNDGSLQTYFQAGEFVNVPVSIEDFDTGGGTLEAEIDGADFSANSSFILAFGSEEFNNINITGTSDDSRQISLNFPLDAMAGSSYQFTETGATQANYITNADDGDFFGSDSGTIEVTAHDPDANTVTGTFSFTSNNGVEPLEVTNGFFDVTYVDIE